MASSALLKQQVTRDYPVAVRGEGVYLHDDRGQRYLDGSSGAMTASLGHGVPEIVEAMADQARRVAFTYRTQFTNQPAEQLARRLVDLAPDGLSHAFFLNSGSEATEYAMRAAVGHWDRRGRPQKVKVLGRQISYHGMTMGALSMSGHPGRRPDYGSLLLDLPVAPAAYPYRLSAEGETEEQYAERAANELAAAVVAEDPSTVAAVILEPIVGAAGGVLVPPAGYLARVRQMCNELDVLLVLDEVITGMGRTGEWFACSDEGVTPDLLVLGKGLSAGYTPVSAVLLHQRLVTAMVAGRHQAPFGHTFSGNPLGAATCIGVLDYMERHRVLPNVRARGDQLGEGLRALADRFRMVADVRGRGLLWGFELVTDPERRTAPPAELDIASALVAACFEEGLIVYPAGIRPLNNAVVLSPPLTITAAEVRQLLDMLGRALERVSHEPVFAHVR